jgi:hypothetical protein
MQLAKAGYLKQNKQTEIIVDVRFLTSARQIINFRRRFVVKTG